MILKPFHKIFPETVSVHAQRKSQDLFELHFQVTTSRAKEFGLEEGSAVGARKDELWKETCFEFFLSEDQSAYWELNISPKGDWQCYHFTSYRSGGTKSSALTLKTLTTKTTSTHFELKALVEGTDLNKATKSQPTTILKMLNNIDYFASKHGPKPDFHDQTLWSKI